MSSKVAPGMASTGPDDSLVAVDAHGSTPSEVVSRFKKTSNEIGGAALDGVSKSMLDPKNIVEVIKVDDGKIGVDSNSLGDVLKDAIIDAADSKRRLDGVKLGNVPGLPSDQAKLAESILDGLVDERYAGLINDAGELYEIASKTDTGSASSLMKAIGKFAGVDAFQGIIDQNAWVATGLSYLDAAMKLGIPNAIDELMKKFKDDKKAREQLISNVRGVILRGDVATLKKIIDWTSAQSVIDQVPDACYLLLSCYRFPRDTKPTQYPELRTELLGVLNDLDATWSTINRNGTEVGYLDPFSRISPDSRKLLQLEPEFDVQLMIASKYRTADLVLTLTKQYPVIRNWLE